MGCGRQVSSTLKASLAGSHILQNPRHVTRFTRLRGTREEGRLHVGEASFQVGVLLNRVLSYVDEAQDNLLIDALGAFSHFYTFQCRINCRFRSAKVYVQQSRRVVLGWRYRTNDLGR